jgi:DNA polymerase III psi subunit
MQTNIKEFIGIYNETLYIEPYDIAINLEGDFIQKILILTLQNNNLPDNIALLNKVMQACNLSPNDYGIAWLPADNVATQVIATHKPNTVISFGVSIGNDAYKLANIAYVAKQFAGFKYVLSHDLNTLTQNTNYRKALWEALQALFNLKK